MKHLLRTLTLAFVALAVVVGTALAENGTDRAIYADAADGSIDGNYTLAQLRHADSQLSADQREYILWDEVYAAKIALMSTPDAPRPDKVSPTDSNGNGKIDPNERAAAAAQTRQRIKEALKKYKGTKRGATTATTDSAAGTIDGVTNAEKSTSKSDTDDDGANWPLIVVLALLIVIAAVAAWRVLSARSKKGPGTGTTDGKFGPRDSDIDTGPGPKR